MQPETYDNADIAKVVVAKTTPLFAQPWPKNLTAIGIDNTFIGLTPSEAARRGRGSVRVLDFGGAAGLHYLWAKRVLRDVPFRWAVVETASLAREAAVLEQDDLHFFDGITEALSWLGGVDVACRSAPSTTRRILKRRSGRSASPALGGGSWPATP